MKSLKLFALPAALAVLALTGCEPHSFEETQKLHMGHGSHGEGHGDDHGKDAAHGGKDHADPHAKDDHGKAKEEAHPAPAKEEPRKTGI